MSEARFAQDHKTARRRAGIEPRKSRFRLIFPAERLKGRNSAASSFVQNEGWRGYNAFFGYTPQDGAGVFNACV
jgi:hypothetical protein